MKIPSKQQLKQELKMISLKKIYIYNLDLEIAWGPILSEMLLTTFKNFKTTEKVTNIYTH